MNQEELLAVVEKSLVDFGVHGRSICVAFSGGKDSSVLLDVLAGLRDKLSIELSALHVNHGLSPNADRWATFCHRRCDDLSLPISVVSVSVDRDAAGGLEAAARKARYAAFQDVPADFLALAQHADDQAETVLHQLFRGTGLKGLSGMGERRRLGPNLELIRPFLRAQRANIDQYAQQNALSWVDDESNSDVQFTRNYIRHELAPILEKRFPQYRDSLDRVARHSAEAARMLEALAEIDLAWDGENGFADKLDNLARERQVNALYHWLHWHNIAQLSQASLYELAGQLFRLPPTSKPHIAAVQGVAIRRVGNLLQMPKVDRKF